jgi:SAM-dependent methyltransferase
MDRAFDALVPDEWRHMSQTHWTPFDVAIRATALLCPAAGTRVLDVGAGIGKVCILGAMAAGGTWCGVEQHARFVDAARTLARAFGVSERTRFLHGDALSIDWREFDAIYLYNPFEFPLFPGTAGGSIDGRVQVARVQDRLAALPDQVRVVTFHGFGGVMPGSYELVYQERMPGVGLDLVLWVQRVKARRVAVTS